LLERGSRTTFIQLNGNFHRSFYLHVSLNQRAARIAYE